jgi:hypothetical protein
MQALVAVTEFMTRHHNEKPVAIIDTLAKIKRPKHPGEDAYAVDYEMGGKLKALADQAPGATVLVVHHTRKAEAADFVDSVSGTQGVAGSVDFVMVLTRKRLSNDAILSVTGRDIPEAEYALHADDGILWRLNGTTLDDARQTAQEQKAAGNMSDLKMSVFRFVADWCGDKPVRATDVAKALKMSGDTAGKNLWRLEQDGWITKVGRGQYQYFKDVSGVSEPLDVGQSCTSSGETNTDNDSDTTTVVSETRQPAHMHPDTSDSPDKKDKQDTSDTLI